MSVTVHRLQILSLEGDLVALSLDCSAGFYVRSLAHDLGEALGTGAHLAALRRTRSGDFTLADSLPLAAAEDDRDAALAAVIPLDRMLLSLSAVVLTEQGARHAAHGRDLGASDVAGGAIGEAEVCRLLNQSGELVGIGQPARAPGLLHPSVVLV